MLQTRSRWDVLPRLFYLRGEKFSVTLNHMAYGEITPGDIMDFLKEHLVLREKAEHVLDHRLQKTEARILEAIEPMARLQERLQEELADVRDQHEHIQKQLEEIRRRLDEINA